MLDDLAKTNAAAAEIRKQVEVAGAYQKEKRKEARKAGMASDAVLAVVTSPNATLRDRMLTLSKQIQNSTIHSVRLAHVMRQPINPKTKELLPQRLTAVQQEVLKAAKNGHDAIHTDVLMSEATLLCREHPVYQEFLRHAGGIGDVTALHLLGRIDIQQAEKPSQLKAYCGVRCGPGGRLIRRTKGEVLTYDQYLRVALYAASSSTLMTLGTMIKGTQDLRSKTEHKLVRYAYEKLHSMAHGPQFHAPSKLYIQGPVEAIPLVRAALDSGASFPKGKDLGSFDPALAGCRVGPAVGAMLGALRWKILSLFLDDLYIIWRSIEGLPVWPTWYDRSRMHTHGGVRLTSLEPRIWTPEEWGALRDDYIPRPMGPAVTELAHWWAGFKSRVASKEELLALETMGEDEGEIGGKEAAE